MKAVTLIFPHQLFAVHPAVAPKRPVYLVEEFLFFRQYNFHRQKLVLHRATMKHYAERLAATNEVEYIDTTDALSDIRHLIPHLSTLGITEIHYTDTVDNWLEKRIQLECKTNKITTFVTPTPSVMNRLEDVEDFFAKKRTYFMADFYAWQRKKRNILLEKDGQPLGGRWSFDTENRKRFPKKEKAPAIDFPAADKHVTEAIHYVETNFTETYGDAQPFHYPVTHDTANQWLDQFLEKRFQHFGIYEDAMVKEEPILYHSVLTPLLNTGLLLPADIIDKAIDTAIRFDVPLNSLEGFIRQIMGWREFIRIVYEREGSRQRTTNYWKFSRKIPLSFWNGTTGIHPIDTVIKRLLKTGYCHHIERLMVLGNFMILCEFDPDEVYRWFMEMFIDSYDWVMVPNVYGMTQFADGGLMTTKPYISGSNYLMKMGDWDKGEWQNTWDGLFWRFLHVHRDFFRTNPRLGMLLGTFDKMPKEKSDAHLANAENFLRDL